MTLRANLTDESATSATLTPTRNPATTTTAEPTAKSTMTKCRCNGQSCSNSDCTHEGGDSCRDWADDGSWWCYVDEGACLDALQGVGGLVSRQACTSSELQAKSLDNWFHSTTAFSWGYSWKEKLATSEWILRCRSSVPWIPPQRPELRVLPPLLQRPDKGERSLVEKLQRVLDNISAMAGGEGLSLGLATENGESLQLASGLVKPWRDKGPQPENVQAESMFAFGSTTKMFTATAILHLVQSNIFELDEKALPLMERAFLRFAGESLLTYFPKYLPAVTVRMLLDMSSGINDLSAAAVAVQQRNLSADVGPGQEIKLTWQALCDPNKPTQNCMFACAPGTCKVYSSLNYVLLGLILAQHFEVDQYWELDQAAALGRGFGALKLRNIRFVQRGLCSKYSRIVRGLQIPVPALILLATSSAC